MNSDKFNILYIDKYYIRLKLIKFNNNKKWDFSTIVSKHSASK